MLTLWDYNFLSRDGSLTLQKIKFLKRIRLTNICAPYYDRSDDLQDEINRWKYFLFKLNYNIGPITVLNLKDTVMVIIKALKELNGIVAIDRFEKITGYISSRIPLCPQREKKVFANVSRVIKSILSMGNVVLLANFNITEYTSWNYTDFYDDELKLMNPRVHKMWFKKDYEDAIENFNSDLDFRPRAIYPEDGFAF